MRQTPVARPHSSDPYQGRRIPDRSGPSSISKEWVVRQVADQLDPHREAEVPNVLSRDVAHATIDGKATEVEGDSIGCFSAPPCESIRVPGTGWEDGVHGTPYAVARLV